MVHSKEELALFCPLGCGIQTGAGTVVSLGKAGPEDSVVIMGLGGVGLAGVMVNTPLLPVHARVSSHNAYQIILGRSDQRVQAYHCNRPCPEPS